MTTASENPSESGAHGREIITVAVIEDQRDIRQGLRYLIDGTDGYRCTGAFGSMEESLRRIAEDVPQVILADLGLPGMSGLEGIPLLRERFPQTLVLVLTVYDDDERIFEAFCGGASGYLLKKTPPVRLLESIREAVHGGAPMSPEVARRVIVLFREVRPPQRADCDLTPHELRLLQLLSEGHSYKTAGAELKLSTNTIKFHVKQIYEKLHVHSKSEAVARALRRHIVK
ncbi:MAG: response regulator transcription factor [Bryobacteraceae bacterium]|jgi:DNA-binding NarL/FixJ family response regulator